MKKLNHSDFSSQKLTRSLISILESTPLCSMATVNSDGTSHINTAYFAFDPDWNIYFLTSPKSRHSQNLTRNNSLALTIFDTHQPWGKSPLMGVQIFGMGWLISSDDVENLAKKCYELRFPRYKKWIKSLTLTEIADLESRFYLFRPTTIKLFDETKFGEETFLEITL